MELKEFLEEFADARSYVTAHTSGSTGTPKPIRLSKADMLRSARASNAHFGITAQSRLICPLSMDYIAGKMMVVRALAAGCSLDIFAPSNRLQLPSDTDRRPADLLAVVPAMVPALLGDPGLHRKVRQMLVGGGEIQAPLCQALAERGITVWLSYGMTETCSHVALARGDDPARIFHAMPGIAFETDSDGRLIINAPGFDFGRVIANDVVELTGSTSFRWLGRSDGVINTGGIKLIPERLEALYRDILPGEVRFFVRGRQDSTWGNAVELVIERNATTAPAETARLLRESALPGHMKPKYITTVARIALTPSGKVRRTQATAEGETVKVG